VLSQRELNRALLSRQLLLDRVDLPEKASPRRAAVLATIEHLVGLQAQAPFPPYAVAAYLRRALARCGRGRGSG